MRIQVRTFLRSLKPIARSALVLAGAAGIMVCTEWIPASIGSPGSIVAPAAMAPGSAQRHSAPSTLRGIRASKAACPGCDRIGSTRKARMSNVASGMRRCAHRANPVAVTSGRNQSAENADLSILLDWHMAASNGYGLGLDKISCSAQAGPAALLRMDALPIDYGEAYEILARIRDESGDAPANTSAPARGQDDPAAALREATE